MHVLFEDDGQLKAGTVLADNDASLQVEAASGKRLKIKAASVLLRFASPGPAEALDDAHKLVADLDADFLWEVMGEDEFGFGDLSREYYGRAPEPGEAAAVALLLASSPMHFYRKGKGRYRKAPPDALKAALASVERKKRDAERCESWVALLVARRLPEPLAEKLPMLLYKPDKNSLEWKALAQACDAQKTNPIELLAACGAISSSHDFHFERFLAETFARGTEFPALGPLPPLPELPVAAVRAFSIDDATTTEIDDALRPCGHVTSWDRRRLACRHSYRVPGVAAHSRVARGRDRACAPVHRLYARSQAHDVARRGRRGIHAAGRCHAARALALSRARRCRRDSAHVDPSRAGSDRCEFALGRNRRCIRERSAIAAGPPWTPELRTLYKLAQRLADVRGKTDIQRIDYSFHVDWNATGANGEAGRVAIVPRQRGSPLDKLIAELMIHVNNTWGKTLADATVAGLYRVQSNGKVKMSTRPGEHQGLGRIICGRARHFAATPTSSISSSSSR